MDSATLVADARGRMWLFDSNHPHALLLSRESLDAICLKAFDQRFSHVARAVLLKAGTSVMKHVRKEERKRQCVCCHACHSL